jgi:hypothetical protein
MSTRVTRTEPGWRQANKFLEIVGSKLRLRLCVLGSSTELLLGELVWEKCTASVIVVGTERSRTAMLAFEVASTQDTAENPVKMFRTESTAFIVHHKWDVSRIERRDWNPATYGPTQKLAIALASQRFGSGDALLAFLREHCTKSLVEYQAGEQLINTCTFTSVIRGIQHALFSRHVLLEDMHSWLVDTVQRPTCGGILHTILQSHEQSPDLACIRLLMYATDTWFGENRLYTVLMMGCMVAASSAAGGLRVDILRKILLDTHALAVSALNRIAERAHRRFRKAHYWVLSHQLNFDSIARILANQYRRNDGHVDETSLRFNSSFWMNILGYYVRLTNGVGALDEEIRLSVHAFLDDVLDLIYEQRPDLSKTGGDENIERRLAACFHVFSAAWDVYVKSAIPPAPAPPAADGGPPAKRQRLDTLN